MENKNSDEIIVKFEEVTKQYGDLVVLDKLNLDQLVSTVTMITPFSVQEKQNHPDNR